MNKEPPAPEAIAVIGMSGRFPGAGNPDEFWNNLIAGKDGITRFPSRTEADGSKYVGARSMIENPDLFDASFFNIYPKEAELMDPQHRVFLECAWEALEDGGCDPEDFPGMIGVYAGLSLNTYLLNNLGTGGNLAKNYQVSEYQTMLGNDKDFLPVRVSYKLNLRGPSMTVQSACSTSLVAIAQAATSLLTYQCDMALAGGVSLSFPQHRDYLYQEDGMVSPDGACRAFDADAAGTVFGHGCGVVLLKRLSEAVADRDPILAVIKGWAVNNDGSDKVGFAAPGVNAQADVIALAQASAGVHPSDVSYVEAHGTGTPLGDPIEVAALTKAFREGGAIGDHFCALGTGKTHIGHLDCAAGVTGLIKTIQQLRHEKIPALLHFKTPNPHIDFANSPFAPVAKNLDWKSNGKPRIAGVSAFGVGGTNAHIVVEEAPPTPPTSSGRAKKLLLLSARSPEALDAMAERLAVHLETTKPNLADVSHTLATGRRAFPHRRAVVAGDLGAAIDALREESRSIETPPSPRKVAFIFPGQGSQYTDMTREIYDAEPAFRAAVDECADLLQPLIEHDIRTTLYPADDQRAAAEKDIHRTALTQPCIFIVEYALAKLWISWGVTPSLLIGHSIGEYVAAVIAGSFELHHAIQLLATRARLMQDLPAGSMLAVRAGISELKLPAGIDLAASNSPHLCTLSGPHETILTYQKELKAREITCRLLKTSHAFHSSMMEPIVAPITEAAAKAPASAPTIPWISSCTGKPIDASILADPGYWARQLRHSVRFSEALETAFHDTSLIMLEVGPGQALAQFARQHPDRGETPVIATLPSSSTDLSDILSATGELWKHGTPADWSAYFQHQQRARLHLPTYPFERKSFWIDRSVDAPLTHPALDPITPPPPMTSNSRLTEIETKLRDLVLELSGIIVSDNHATFTELGFDSLFLTQASQAIQSRFGVKVTFRQMLGDLSCVSTLAKYLDAEMPASAITPTPQPIAVISNTPPSATGSTLEQLLANNLEIMQTLVAERKSTPAAVVTEGDYEPVIWPANFTRNTSSNTRFGPYKPVETGSNGNLTKSQHEALAKLTSDYCAKTSSSKNYTADHRPHFADPRAVSGFKSQWKEMVYPIVSSRSKGSRIWDIDDNEYVDITMGFGTYYFGHSPEWLTKAIQEQLETGMEIGPQSAISGKLAKALCELTGMERTTFCNTGSEAVMAAMRLARTVTGRNRIAYFTGDYHGMFEEVLVRGAWIDGVYKAQSVAPGIPASLVENMLVLDYADPASLEILKAHAHELAAVMIEPVQSRAPGLQPREFMHEVRAITEKSGSALIFDEVVTGFRCAPGGAQEYFGVKADIATYGKVIGGGMPIGVLSGKRKYMDALDGGAWSYGDDSFPEVGVTFFAGTFVRHPLAMAAAWSVIQHIQTEGPRLQIDMEERVARLCHTLNSHFENVGVPIRIPHFSAFAVIDYAPELKHASLLWYYLRQKGIHVWEGRPLYFTTAHSDKDFDLIVKAFTESVAEMQAAGFLPPSPANHRAAPREFPRFDSAPTTEAQREIFHAVQMGDDANCAFNESNIIRFDGELSTSALKTALNDIIVRHPALRSTFSEDGSTQYFHPSSRSIELIEHDFTTIDPASPSSLLPLSLIKRSESSVPFDLTHGPLFRIHLIHLSESSHELIFTAHHMICDGWSFGMILAELATAYNARSAEALPALPPAMSFAEYARIEAENKDGKLFREAEKYWISRFQGETPILDLPTDRARPALKSYPGAMEAITIDPARYERLKQVSPKLGGTLFATLLSSFATLLHRITDQEDIVIGVPAAGQTRVGRDELVGHCLNFLPLRLQPTSDRPFNTFAADVKEQVLEAYDHQNHTFGSLLKNINLTRDTSRVPLVSVIFNIDKVGSDQIHFDQLKFDITTNPKQFVNFDLFFNLVQSDKKLIVECEYNTDLHDASTIRSWLDTYEQLIESVINNGDSALRDLEILTADDRRTLDLWNETDSPTPVEQSIQCFFENQVDANPLAIALRAADRSFTYQELDRHANALASELKRNGVTRETLVGICAERRAETIVAILAVLKAGGAYVPIDPKYPKDRIAYILSDAAAPILLTQRSLVDSLPSQKDRHTLFIDDCLQYSTDRSDSTTTPEDLAYIIYTSGSTGLPKGVALEHRNTIALIDWARTVYKPEELVGMLFSTSICFDLSIFEMFVTLASGGSMILAENALDLSGHPHADAITFISTVPSAITELLDADLIPASVKTMNLAGEALSQSLVNRIYQSYPGIKIYDLYGPSEDTTYSTFARRELGGRASIGKPISNTRAYIVNRNGHLVSPGIAGELMISGAGLARGYLNRPELTAEKFIPNPFGATPGSRIYRTGDRVRFLENGDIQFLGRFDHQVKLRGYRIELGEIESLLEQHPAIGKAIAHVEDNRLTAFATSVGDSNPTEIWQNQWDLLFKSAIEQSGGKELDRIDSVIAGWAGVENLDAHIAEWIDTTTKRIQSFNGKRILEIGCGTGQLLSRLAPDAECYWASDISKVAIDALNNNQQPAGTKLLHRPAHDFHDIPESYFDTVVINSVAQYFPDASYLLNVLTCVSRTLKPGGKLFLGDVQGNALLTTHHLMALREHAPDQCSSGKLRESLAQRISQETELSIDPAWFDAVAADLPGISHIETLLRRGELSNETTTYHYDVVLHAGPAPTLRELPVATSWNKLNLEQLEAMLSDGKSVLRLTDIPDARLAVPVAFRRAIENTDDSAPLPSLSQTALNAVSAECLFKVAVNSGHRVHIRRQDDGTNGLLDAVFFPESESALPDWPKTPLTKPSSSFTNVPRSAPARSADLEPELRKHLVARLPDYMIPGNIILLDEFPLTPNGKIDRKALATHGAQPPSENAPPSEVAAPIRPVESQLLDIWSTVLGKSGFGVHDDIFALGGDSILIFQITTRATREGLSVTPAMVFKHRNIAALAAEITLGKVITPPTSTIQRVNRDAYHRKF